jgi:saccharopine dehydrogenase-like NADP-dependent oxidoreductase
MMELGFLNKESIDVNGTSVRPLDFTIEVLRRIPVPQGYSEKENVWLKVYGEKNGEKLVAEMDAVAGTIAGWEDATCNIDTGFPTSILAQMIYRGEVAERGLFSPEFIIDPEPFFRYLGEKKIHIYDNGKRINGHRLSTEISAVMPSVPYGKATVA